MGLEKLEAGCVGYLDLYQYSLYLELYIVSVVNGLNILELVGHDIGHFLDTPGLPLG